MRRSHPLAIFPFPCFCIVKETILPIWKSRIEKERHMLDESLQHLSTLINGWIPEMSNESAVLWLSGHFVVVGDLHSTIDDLFQILFACGWPPSTSFLLLGDNIYRGDHSIEVLFLLFSLKVLFPRQVYILRGNHVHDVCQQSSVSHATRDYMRVIPRNANHSGAQSLQISRPWRIVPGHPGHNADQKHQPPVRDLLGSDPSRNARRFQTSQCRSGLSLSEDATKNCLSRSARSLVIRANQQCDNGSCKTFECCLTVFSACDYRASGNFGAVALVHADNQDSAVPPYRAPAVAPRPPLLDNVFGESSETSDSPDFDI
jgi:protein phosphatase